MELTAKELWSRILDLAEAQVHEQAFRTWLSRTDAIALSGSELLVEAPSPFHVEWVEDKFGTMLDGFARRVVGRPLHVRLKAAASAPPVRFPSLEPDEEPTADEAPTPAAVPPHAQGLNGRYTFDRFVVGDNVQLAAAACRAVAEQPARMYNPLFLYGGVGLGKTHLMHAIGNHLLEAQPQARVTYVSSEGFTNELVGSIRQGSAPEFRSRYRKVDLLLVDDIQFLAGKERTQEEFFHTFNALYDAGSQIVLTCDRPPKDLPGLEERLVSRFEWGLVADVKPPDYETRVAILRKKADDDRLTLEPDVIDFVARSYTSSVRELEGAILKLLAYSSLTRRDIDLPLARQALEGMIARARGASGSGLTVEAIQDAVAEAWHVTRHGLVSKRRTRDLTVPRQVAMSLTKELLGWSLTRIGRSFGGRDHSTVIHSVRKVSQQAAEDPEFASTVDGVRRRLEGRV